MDADKKIEEELLNRLFIEKVQRLKKNRFLKFCLKASSFQIQQQDPFNFPVIDGISRQSIDAFVLHFRLLILQKDKISYEDTYNRLKKYGFISEKTKELFEECEKYKNTELKPTVGGKQYTFFQFFTVIFYGGLAHHNPDKVKEFLQIAHHVLISGIALSFFVNCIKKIFAVCKSLEIDIKKYQKHLSSQN